MSKQQKTLDLTSIVEIERWLLREGMPFVVRGIRRHPTMARALPFTLFALVCELGWALLNGIVYWFPKYRALGPAEAIDAMEDNDVYNLLYILAVPLLGALASWGFLQLRRHHPVLRGRSAGIIGATALFVLTPIAHGVSVWSRADLVGATVYTAGLVVGIYLLVRSGLAALLSWALRHLIPHLSNLVQFSTRAVPLLLLLVTFLFINTENWQMSAALDRQQLWAVAWFFIVLILLFLLARFPEELKKLNVHVNADSVREACKGTQLGELAAKLPDTDLEFDKHPMRRRERGNVLAIMIVSQSIQILLLGVVVWLFFVVFGKIAISEKVIEAWIGEPSHPGILFKVFEIPGVSKELIQVSIVIASFSALYFAVYAVNDAGYREQFFDKMLTELQRILLARECYLRLRELYADGKGAEEVEDLEEAAALWGEQSVKHPGHD